MAKKKEEVKEEVVEETTVKEEVKEASVKNKNLTVKDVFRDKYEDKIVYNIGDIFVEDEKLEGNTPVKVEDGKYKVSKERYAELQRSLYTD